MLNPRQLSWRLFGSVMVVMALVFGALISSWVGMNAEEEGKLAVFEATRLERDALDARAIAAELAAAQSAYALDILRSSGSRDRQTYLRVLAQLGDRLAAVAAADLEPQQEVLLRAAQRAVDRFHKIDREIEAVVRRGSRRDELKAADYAADAASAQLLHASDMVRLLAERATRRAAETSTAASVAAYRARILLIAFGGASLLLALVFARVLSESMSKRAELMDRLGELARVDGLTGVANRRAWDEDLGKGLERARRTGERCTIGVIDLDHFKKYNDTHGHPQGDELLKMTAQALAGRLRRGDLIARYGGEEFAVLLHRCDVQNARDLFARLHEVVPFGQTVSAGITDSDGDEDPELAFARADAALYQAKAEGRNRTVIAAARR